MLVKDTLLRNLTSGTKPIEDTQNLNYMEAHAQIKNLIVLLHFYYRVTGWNQPSRTMEPPVWISGSNGNKGHSLVLQSAAPIPHALRSS